MAEVAVKSATKAKAPDAPAKTSSAPKGPVEEHPTTVSNQAALAAWHSSLRVAPPDDPSERDADATVERVMRSADGACCSGCAGGGSCDDNMVKRAADGSKSAGGNGGAHLSRATASQIRTATRGGEPLPLSLRSFFEPRMGRDLGGTASQPQLAINQPGDLYEQEADRIADQVLAMPADRIVSSAPPRIQRLAGPSAGPAAAPPASVGQVVAGRGTPLPSGLRRDMEQRFSHDFSTVRVHSDAKAAESARALDALAYTVGENLVFGTGQYAPQTEGGRRLLAHELTHVLQQRGSGAYRIQRQLGCPSLQANPGIAGLFPGKLIHAYIGQHFRGTVAGARGIAIPGASADPLRTQGLCGADDKVIDPQEFGDEGPLAGAGIPDLARIGPEGVLEVAEIKPAVLPCLVDGIPQLAGYVLHGNAPDLVASAWRARQRPRVRIVVPMSESTYTPPNLRLAVHGGIATTELRTAWCGPGLLGYTVNVSFTPPPLRAPEPVPQEAPAQARGRSAAYEFEQPPEWQRPPKPERAPPWYVPPITTLGLWVAQYGYETWQRGKAGYQGFQAARLAYATARGAALLESGAAASTSVATTTAAGATAAETTLAGAATAAETATAAGGATAAAEVTGGAIAGGGGLAVAAGALPVVAMAGVFVALGSGYAQAREDAKAESGASGFSQGFVMGLLGWEWHHVVDRFGVFSAASTPQDEVIAYIRANAYNRGLKAGFHATAELSADTRRAYLREIRNAGGPRAPGSWSRQDQISYVIDLAVVARLHFLKPE